MKRIQKRWKKWGSKVKERKRREGKRDEEEERVIYKVNCKDCNNIYIYIYIYIYILGKRSLL